MTSVLEPVLHEESRVLGVPLVVIDPAGSPVLDVPTIGAANRSDGLAATKHLPALGHRRIGSGSALVGAAVDHGGPTAGERPGSPRVELGTEPVVRASTASPVRRVT